MIDEIAEQESKDVVAGESYKMLAACGALPTDKDDELGVKRVRTHIPALDELTNGGLQPGLHCVTGGPASYKTATMLQMAYHVALDGQEVLYITDEIGKQECLYRLIAHQLQLDCIIAGEMADAPAWSVMGEVISGAVNGADEKALVKITEAAQKVAESKLRIVEMGPRIKSYRLLPRELVRKGCRLVREERCREDNEYVCHNARYLPSLYLNASSECGGTGWEEFDELCGSSALVVIDAVNQLRLWKWVQGYDEEENTRYTDYSELTVDRRTHMDEVVEALDRMGRKEGMAVAGIFHTARTTW